jgi:hypothetical protein
VISSEAIACDFIKVERLINPDNADNTQDSRLVADAEFSHAGGGSYWWTLLLGSAVSPVFSASGGMVDGKAAFSPRSGGSSSALIISRTRPPQYAVAGELYTISVRWRRTGSYSSGPPFLVGRVVRHGQDGSNPVFSGSYGTDYQLGAGALVIVADTSYTVGTWYESSAYCSVPIVDTGLTSNALQYVSVMLECSGGTTGDDDVEVDYVNLTKGGSAHPLVKTISTSGATAIAREDIYTQMHYDNAGAATFNLPVATLWPGASVFFDQVGAGTLTIAYPSGTLLSMPNTTGSRTLAGRYAKAFADWDGTNWTVVGQLA